MKLKLLIDEDSQAIVLIDLLRESGHNILTVSEADLKGQADSIVFARAVTESRTIVTRNCSDFLSIHKNNPEHNGILAIYQYADGRKNLSYAEIVRAISNLLASGTIVEREFIVLNQWHY